MCKLMIVVVSCLVAFSAANPVFDFEAKLQEAEAVARGAVPLIDNVLDAIPAVVSTAQQLRDAADVLTELNGQQQQLNDLRTEVREAEADSDNRQVRRDTLGAISDLLGAVRSVGNDYDRLMTKLDNIVGSVQDAETSIQQERTIVDTEPPITPNPCDSGIEGFETNGDYCYHFSNLYRTWAEARVVCQEYGMDLIDITTPEELTYVWNNGRSYQHGAWVGGRRVGLDSLYEWVRTGEEVQNQGSYALHRYTTTHTTCIYIENSHNLYDQPCNGRRSFACKSPIPA